MKFKSHILIDDLLKFQKKKKKIGVLDHIQYILLKLISLYLKFISKYIVLNITCINIKPHLLKIRLNFSIFL